MVPTGFPDSVSIAHAGMVWSAVRSIAWQSSMGYSKLRQLVDVNHVINQVTIFYQQGMRQSLLARVGFNNKWSVVIKSLQWWNMIVCYLSRNYSRSESQVYIDCKPPPTNMKQNRPHLNHLNDVELNRRDGKRRTCSGEKSSVIESNIENDYFPVKLSQVFFHTYLPNG